MASPSIVPEVDVMVIIDVSQFLTMNLEPMPAVTALGNTTLAADPEQQTILSFNNTLYGVVVIVVNCDVGKNSLDTNPVTESNNA